MKNHNLLLVYILVLFQLLNACAFTPQIKNLPETTATVTNEVSAINITAETPIPTPTESLYLIPNIEFMDGSTFCINEPEDSQFSLNCTDGKLHISQTENRRGMDIYLLRQEVVQAKGFILTANISTQPAETSKIDQNNYGFYYTTSAGGIYAIRIQSQYVGFERWDLSDGVEIIDSYNQTYVPEIHYTGRSNQFRLVCDMYACSLYANDALAARSPFEVGGQITAIGFFTASGWNQQFGEVSLENFVVADLPTNYPETQTFVLTDSLSRDNETFSKMGLSGAFSEFEADGFHFSPVIPYGYYAAKAGPSFSNMSVGAIVNMDFKPGVKATQYAGVVCRSNQDGMYIAVLRVDGTYTIYRDTEQRPFALLAKDEIEGIGTGRSKVSIRMDCVKDNIFFYINDVQVESFTDSRYGIRYGRAGLYTKAGGTPYSDAIIFSDFFVSEIR